MGRGFLFRPTIGNPVPPPPNFGRRSTDRLSTRAARKIKGAALNANALGLGLVTFMTFTCAPEDRRRIANGSLTLSREMKRTLNAIRQRFRREGHADFAFIWVAENPHDQNPHVHMLTNHRVDRSEFGEYAAWVESLWRHGWVKIEKVRNPTRAGYYILKAVGYALKGEDGKQGTVCGNRYGISRNIRVDEEVFDLHGFEDAADTLHALARSLPDGSDIEVLADGVYLTRYGMAFGAGTSLQQIACVVTGMRSGVLPS